MKTFLAATTLFVILFLHLLAAKPHKHVIILVSPQSQEHQLNYQAGVRETPKWASHMQVKLIRYGLNVPFPKKMLPTLCREFSNLMCLVFWRTLAVWKCPTSSATTTFNKNDDTYSKEIKWKWCYFQQKVLLKSFVWYQISQE